MAALQPREKLLLSIEQETRRPQKESGRFGEGNNISPLPGIEQWFISPPIGPQSSSR
jgi:hypothetical protein